VIRGPALAATLLLALPCAAAEVEAGYGYDHLDRGDQDWQSATLEVAGAAAERVEVRGGARGTERFGLRDLELSGGLVLKTLPRWAIALDAAWSPTHRVLPFAAAGALASRELGSGWVAAGGLRWMEYRTSAGRSDGAVASAGLERYVRAWRLAGTGYLAALGGEWSGAGRIALDRFYGDEGRAGLALSAGQEMENTGRRILRTDVRAASLSGRHPLGGGWSLGWELAAQRQGHAYTRLGGRLAARRRF
jgi:YaiO family outer membrane protein